MSLKLGDLDKFFKFALGEFVFVASDVEHARNELLMGDNVAFPAVGLITERCLVECHGGIKTYYTVQFHINSIKCVETALVRYSDVDFDTYTIKPTKGESSDVHSSDKPPTGESSATDSTPRPDPPKAA